MGTAAHWHGWGTSRSCGYKDNTHIVISKYKYMHWFYSSFNLLFNPQDRRVYSLPRICGSDGLISTADTRKSFYKTNKICILERVWLPTCAAKWNALFFNRFPYLRGEVMWQPAFALYLTVSKIAQSYEQFFIKCSGNSEKELGKSLLHYGQAPDVALRLKKPVTM